MDTPPPPTSVPDERKERRKQKQEQKQKKQGTPNTKGKGAAQQPSSKLRGNPLRDAPEVQISKTLSWMLRHGAKEEGLVMRPDGYAKVVDVLGNPKLKTLDFESLQEIVQADKKNRYGLLFEPDQDSDAPGIWWIRANQGHSIRSVKVDFTPILSIQDIPSGVAVHGTNLRAWQSISKEGLRRMTRNHIHLAQGIPGADSVISGMRTSSQILIYIDVEKALADGIKFFMSANGVVLTEGNPETGVLSTKYFSKVENAKRQTLEVWGTEQEKDSGDGVRENSEQLGGMAETPA